MKRRLGLLLCALLLLPGCHPAPAEETALPTPSPVQTPEPTPEPAPALESWQTGYIQLLQEDGREERDKAWEAEMGFPSVEVDYLLYDVDKDGLPELFLRRYGLGAFYFDVYTCPGEEPLFTGTFYGGRVASNLYSCPGENGVLSEASRADPYGETHWWRKFALEDGSLEGTELLDEVLRWEEDEWFPAKPEDFAPGATLLGEPTGLSSLDFYPILDYTPLLAPWQEAYRDILLHPEEYEEFYAVAEHIPSDQYERREIPAKIEHYCFAVCDVNGDGTQELLLWGDHLLLNILRYHEGTGTVEDMDGPRTYPLMDTLFFYDTGYFDTINGTGGLYTECWRLEEEDPDRYWYGYQRPYDSDYDGPRTTEIISFYSSDGEEFTLREYYERMGESGVTPSWQEVTEGAVLRALLAADGKEAP